MQVSLRDQILFFKQLAILIKSGVPILAALLMLQKQSQGRALQKILQQVARDVENGQYLATALGKFKNIFGELAVNIIAVGEISGTLGDNLNHLAQTLKKKQVLRRKILSASVYPIFVVVATLLMTVVLVVFVFPKIIPVFKSINYKLPWTTRSIIFISNLVKTQGWLIFFTLIILIIALWFLQKNKKVRAWRDTVLLYIPFIKSPIQAYNINAICRTMGLLLTSGTGVVRSFQVTADTTANTVYKKELIIIAENITKGGQASTHMATLPLLFPAMVSQMLAVGEGTGKLSETFLYLSDVYEEEMDDLTKNISTTVEPLLLIFMGLLVGFIAVSIITPIYGITQHLNSR